MISTMKEFFKRYVPTSDPDNLHTPPLPEEELAAWRIAAVKAEVEAENEAEIEAFHSVGATTSPTNAGTPRHSARLNAQPRFSSLSPSQSLGSGMSNLDIDSDSTLSPGSNVTVRSAGRVGKKRGSVTTPKNASREFSRESSMEGGPSKRTRSYKLKNDKQRSDPEYQKMRRENNEAVKRSRIKKEQKEAEAKRKVDEERELYRGAIRMLLERYEWDSIVHSAGLFIMPETTLSLNLGNMTTEQWSLVQDIRKEVEHKAMRVARR